MDRFGGSLTIVKGWVITWQGAYFWSGSGKPLSKPLSYKERGFEFSPFRATKALASSGFPHRTKCLISIFLDGVKSQCKEKGVRVGV